ncbi:MAG: glycosyltransferase family 4 protein [Candidatus Omnitrophota bacterium]|nr:MAG: glycosyltransferase family 4 protein [Candidatus Omnitrophota bacterium]
MRVLFVPYGTDRAPATRYRVTQYLPHLAERGIDYSVFSAISKLSTALMIKSPDFTPLARFLYYVYVSAERLFRFLAIVFICRGFDIIFLQRTTFPLRLEMLLKMLNKNIIFDIDDAIYLPDREGDDFVTRIKKYIKKNEVINILKISRIVIVENEYIKRFVSQYCKEISKLPGPIDTERFFVRNKKGLDRVVIGWIGSPATTSYLHMLDNVFRDIKRKYDFVKFRFIGLGKYKNPPVEFERIDWNSETEVGSLQGFDIGIMPMPDNEWTRGKLGCKMLQYMAVGIPAVVSYTPTNAEIIDDGENGFFVTKENEWTDLLSMLVEDAPLRSKIGERARNTIQELCSLRKSVTYLVKIFESLKD